MWVRGIFVCIRHDAPPNRGGPRGRPIGVKLRDWGGIPVGAGVGMWWGGGACTALGWRGGNAALPTILPSPTGRSTPFLILTPIGRPSWPPWRSTSHPAFLPALGPIWYTEK